jgi:uncharacterized protein (DUF1800 family)
VSVDPVVQKQVARLFARAGFGASLDTINQWAAQGYAATVANLLSFAPASSPTRTDTATILFAQQLAEEDDRALSVGQRNIRLYEQWWFNRMATTAYPLEEKLTLYWHGHFATSFYKNGLLGAMLTQNRMLRENAAGDFRQMLYLINADVAMLLWLDNAYNRAGHSNENYARELMELFTLGRDQYTQTDVTQVARAVTGFSISGYTATLNASWHDQGLKTILGNGPANYGPNDVVNLVLDHHPQGPVAAQYVAQRLASFFHRPNPSATLVQAMAKSFAGAAGQPYPITSMLTTLFTSSDFMNDTLVGIKCPAEFVAGAIAALGMATDPTQGLTTSTSTQWANVSIAMGQELFAPPNVAGWKGGATWANTAGALARYNFAAALASQVASNTVQATLDQVNGVPRATAGPWMNRLGLLSLSAQTQQGLDQYVNAATTAKDSATTITRGILTLLLASPDYMLR